MISSLTRVIGLERLYIEGSCPLGGDRLGDREDAGKGGIMGYFLEESGLADGLRIGLRYLAFGGVENELDFAVLQRVHDIGPALEDLVYFGAVEPFCFEIALGAAGGADLEAEVDELAHGRNDLR